MYLLFQQVEFFVLHALLKNQEVADWYRLLLLHNHGSKVNNAMTLLIDLPFYRGFLAALAPVYNIPHL